MTKKKKTPEDDKGFLGRHRSMEPLKINPSTRDAEFLRIRVDTLVGMAVSNVIGIAIIRP